jgi:signal transduction histidine kinase
MLVDTHARRMVSDPTVDDRLRRRSIFRWGAAIVLLSAIVPALSGGDLATVLTLQTLWAVWVFAAGELLGRQVLSVARAGLVSTAGGMLFLPAIVFASGQTGSSFYLLLLCLPLIIASMAPMDQSSVLMSAVGGLAWIVGLEVHAGHGGGRIISWAVFSLLSSAIAAWATVIHRRSEADRLRAEEARLAAVECLAARELKEARNERLALLGQLAASIAHEVNNPLSYVASNVSYLGALLKETNANDDRLQVLQETTEGLERIGNTIRMLQVFVQTNDGPPTGNVSEAVGDALALVAGRLRRVAVPSTSVPAGLPAVALGHRRLVQLLVNLLLNAADAVEGTPSPPRVSVGAEQVAGRVHLIVEDSGPPPALDRHLMPSDFKLGEAGGMGLALCREHVEGAGGSISVERPPGGGSRVIVALPVSPAQG